MNDRFTFRAWNIAQKRYMEDLRLIGFGEINTFREVEEAELDKYGQPQHYTTYEEDEVVLEQCTGLKDKNGKLIYEGDILGYFDNKIAVVYDNESPSFRLRGLDGSHYGHLSQEYVDSFGFKIIGNIHEKDSK